MVLQRVATPVGKVPWKTALITFAVGAILGSAWTYHSYYDLPSRVAAALSAPRLEWQAPAPPVLAGGWLNSPGGSLPDLRERVVLVDVWADWCDPCMATVPALVRLYDRFKDRVVFVGLTAGDRLAAETYVQRFGITWPVGYNSSPETQQTMAGIGPLIFIIGPDGRVFWYDDRARLHHQTSNLWRRVEQELELALAEAQ